MDSFESWRREVNIILNDTLGFSLGEMEDHVEENVKRLYEDGEDPMDAAQYAAGELNPAIDLEQILIDRITPKTKPISKKNVKKFKVADEGL